MIIQNFFNNSEEKILISHGNCSDGFGAAWAIWKEYGDSVRYHFATHSDAPYLYKNKAILFLDFAYERKIMDVLDKTNKLLVIDHHSYSVEDLKGFKNAILDMKKSGAVLAWEHLYPNIEVPTILKYVQDRDLRKFELPYSHEVLSVLDTIPKTFKNWELFSLSLDKDFSSIVEKGKILKNQFNNILNGIIKEARPVNIDGYNGLVVNANWEFASYAADKLSEKADFGIAWFIDKSGQAKCSFRSSNGLNVNNLAAIYGGGGHDHSAGATISLDTLTRMLNNEDALLEKSHPKIKIR